MRRITLIAAVSVTMLPLAGFAQQTTGTAGTPPPSTLEIAPAMGAPGIPNVVPQVGGPLDPISQTGRVIVASDGVSTKIVKAVPCSTAARETDGTTTCVGIPARRKRSAN
jgi:hypothetical protein